MGSTVQAADASNSTEIGKHQIGKEVNIQQEPNPIAMAQI
jgi:hypothetical protein